MIISIIVPIFNVARFLPKCIQSIIDQSFQDMEIILVDDGSTDESAEICASFECADERIQIVRKENGGLVSARKAGLAISSGEFVLFVDGDDYLESDYVERMLETALSEQADMVCAGYYLDYPIETSKVLNRIACGEYGGLEIAPKAFFTGTFYEFGIHPYVWAKLIRRSILSQILEEVPDCISLGEDVAITFATMLECSKVVISDIVGYHYIQRENSITHKQTQLEFEANSALIGFLRERFEKVYPKNNLLHSLNQYAKLIFLYRNLDYLYEDIDILPFDVKVSHSEVVIYGAGYLGISLMKHFRGKTPVVAWLDRDWEKYNSIGMKIDNPEIFDYSAHADAMFFLGCGSERSASSIKDDLIRKGVREQKICWINHKFLKENYDFLDKICPSIYLFGAHSRARTAALYLKNINPGMTIRAFLVDNDEANSSIVDGIPVIKLDSLNNKEEFTKAVNTNLRVYLGIRGIHHFAVSKRLMELGFRSENIIPITPEFDNEIRNCFLRQYFRKMGCSFNKIDNYGTKLESIVPDACVYVAKTEHDAQIELNQTNSFWEKDLQVGASLTERIVSDVKDSSGDNISEFNRQFCELTGLYWIWKNAKEKIVGLEHYRRHFVLPDEWLEKMIGNDIDVILPTPLCVVPSIAQNYRDRHVEEDWICLSEYIKKNLPEEYDSFTDFFENTGIYSPCNMFIMKREVLDELCSWMFPILFACVEIIGEHEDTYQNRYPGFMSERLMTYFFEHNKDKYRVVYADKNFLT